MSEDAGRTMRYSRRPADEAAAWQRDVRKRLLGVLKVDDLPSARTLPLNPAVVSTEERAGYQLREIEIDSVPGKRMQCVVTIPSGRTGPFPAIVCIAGHGSTRHTFYGSESGYHGIGQLLARGGYVTISTEVSRHTLRDPAHTLPGERLWDLMRCVDYLASLPEVDRERIGCAGKSLGGEMATWLSAMDERIKAVVVAGFLTTMDRMEHDHCMCWKVPGLRDLVDWPDVFALIAPRPLLCQNGHKEPPTQFPVSLARKALREIAPIYADYGCPQHARLLAHKGGHEFEVPSVLAFFREHLQNRATGSSSTAPQTPPSPQ